jgi:hypothetical protein
MYKEQNIKEEESPIDHLLEALNKCLTLNCVLITVDM